MDPDNNQQAQAFMQSTVGQMIKNAAQAEKQEELNKEEIKELKKALNQIFTSKPGKLFYKYLVRFCELHTFDVTINPAKLLKDSGKREIYNKLIRPYLDKTTIIELENQ